MESVKLNLREKSLSCRTVQRVLAFNTKSAIYKRKNDKLKFIELLKKNTL